MQGTHSVRSKHPVHRWVIKPRSLFTFQGKLCACSNCFFVSLVQFKFLMLQFTRKLTCIISPQLLSTGAVMLSDGLQLLRGKGHVQGKEKEFEKNS